MKKAIFKIIKTCAVLAAGVVLFSCSMQLDSLERSEPASSVTNIRSMMNRTDSEQML